MQLQVREKSALRTCIKWSCKPLFPKGNNKKTGDERVYATATHPISHQGQPLFFHSAKRYHLQPEA
jgi:hypothetical protein